MQAETLRIATYDAELSRKGPGLLLRDIRRGDDTQIIAALSVIAVVDADVILLTRIDYDHGLVALGALADALANAGRPYPYRFALRPNTGMSTGLDLDGNGLLGDARDAQGYGRFAGQGGMAILSRLPIVTDAARDFSGFLWIDLPGALLPEGMSDTAKSVQRLSSTAHWEVPVALPDGTILRLLAWHATPPVFDGPEDRNGKRNHDEAAFWLRLLAGDLPFRAPDPPFILLGQAEMDPSDGDGLPDAIAALLNHASLQDPSPAAVFAPPPKPG
ncbi:MAG: endonuclease/exonuclease/phosphatase family protein, partial [Paracoccaceae bacterium]|nr:endonuclease/exonuclease/phosphatase family protein [Paracoccaceae bacterium]